MSNIEVIDPETFIEDIDSDDYNYCTVIALSVVTGASLWIVKSILVNSAGKRGKG